MTSPFAQSTRAESATHTDHDSRTHQSDFSRAFALAAEGLTEKRFPHRALSAMVGVACREMYLERLRVVRECIAAGRKNPAYLDSADHLIRATIRDLGGAL